MINSIVQAILMVLACIMLNTHQTEFMWYILALLLATAINGVRDRL